jgi:hypothetical protein
LPKLKKAKPFTTEGHEGNRGRSGDLMIGKGNIYHGGAAKAKAYRGFAQMSADRAKTYHGEERRKPILTTDEDGQH